jgi:hypothetical protein
MEIVAHLDTTHMGRLDRTTNQSTGQGKTYKMIMNSFVCEPIWACYTKPKFGDFPPVSSTRRSPDPGAILWLVRPFRLTRWLLGWPMRPRQHVQFPMFLTWWQQRVAPGSASRYPDKAPRTTTQFTPYTAATTTPVKV